MLVECYNSDSKGFCNLIGYDIIQDRGDYSRRHYQRHRMKILKRQRAYKQTPKGKLNRFKGHCKRRKKHPFKLNAKDIQHIMTRDKVCVYCGSSENLEIDHIRPDGPTQISNLVLCCTSCNSQKHRKNVFDWCCEKNIQVPIIVKKLMNIKQMKVIHFTQPN